MKSRIIKLSISFIITIAMFLLITSKVNAANLTISAKESVKPGETFTVTVSLKGGAGPISASTTNGTGSKKEWLDDNSFSFSCKAGTTGNVTIKASGTVGDYVTEKDVTVNNTKVVKIIENITPKPTPTPQKTTTKKKTSTVKKSEEKKADKENAEKEEIKYLLEELQIEGVKLDPTFDSNKLAYTVNFEGVETNKLNIKTKANTSEAIINISGNENLQLGENIIEIELKGQDDKQITKYTIKAIKEKSKLDIANENVEQLSKEKNLYIKIIIFESVIIFMNIIIFILIKKNRTNVVS